jgi:hypothetical protein
MVMHIQTEQVIGGISIIEKRIIHTAEKTSRHIVIQTTTLTNLFDEAIDIDITDKGISPITIQAGKSERTQSGHTA